MESQNMLLPHCKHVERTGARKACKLLLVERSHKRGHVSVVCKAGHQWVWCELCCNCKRATLPDGQLQRGCTVPAHWMERDSFDTGKRNHMMCHERQLQYQQQSHSPPAASSPQTSAFSSVSSASSTARKGLDSVRGLPSQHTSSPEEGKSGATKQGVLATGARTIAPSTKRMREASLTEANVDRAVRQRAMSGSPSSSSSSEVTGPGPESTCSDSPAPGTDSLEGVTILCMCKHIDRKHTRQPCPFTLSRRSHKRGHLAAACAAGHQWVWCRYCCDCPIPGQGCQNPMHWMERDSFDTGKRNHMMRHLDDYDAKDDEDGSRLRAHAITTAESVKAARSRNACIESSPTPEPLFPAGALEEGHGTMPPPTWPKPMACGLPSLGAFVSSDEVGQSQKPSGNFSGIEESDSWAEQMAAELGSVGNAAVVLLNLQRTVLTQAQVAA